MGTKVDLLRLMDATLLPVLDPHMVSVSDRGMTNGTPDWRRRDSRGAYGVAVVEWSVLKGSRPGQDAFDMKK